MTATLTLELPIKAQAKERPRLGLRGTYTPQRTRVFERLVALLATAQAKSQRWQRLAVPCAVRIDVRGSGIRGDVDNLAKSILDGLNGVAFDDDALVCRVYSRKPIPAKFLPKPPRGTPKTPPHIRVFVWPIDLTEGDSNEQ